MPSGHPARRRRYVWRRTLLSAAFDSRRRPRSDAQGVTGLLVGRARNEYTAKSRVRTATSVTYVLAAQEGTIYVEPA